MSALLDELRTLGAISLAMLVTFLSFPGALLSDLFC